LLWLSCSDFESDIKLTTQNLSSLAHELLDDLILERYIDVLLQKLKLWCIFTGCQWRNSGDHLDVFTDDRRRRASVPQSILRRSMSPAAIIVAIDTA